LRASTRARSSSTAWGEEALVGERTNAPDAIWRPEFPLRCATTAWAAARSLWRCAIWLFAVATALIACCSCASACRRWASSTSRTISATTPSAVTNSPRARGYLHPAGCPAGGVDLDGFDGNAAADQAGFAFLRP
jgi:hypothetical protein